MSNASVELHLIRHGQTEWSLSGRHTGRSEIPLTPEGEADARDLSSALAGVAFNRVLVSPRVRARDTCALAGLGDRAVVEPALAEWDYGDYEGLTSKEIHVGRPGWDIYVDGCPGGETPKAVAARADELLARLRSEGGVIALFSHGHFGTVLAARWIGAPTSLGRSLLFEPARRGVLQDHPAHPEIPVIGLWNLGPRVGG